MIIEQSDCFSPSHRNRGFVSNVSASRFFFTIYQHQIGVLIGVFKLLISYVEEIVRKIIYKVNVNTTASSNPCPQQLVHEDRASSGLLDLTTAAFRREVDARQHVLEE